MREKIFDMPFAKVYPFSLLFKALNHQLLAVSASHLVSEYFIDWEYADFYPHPRPFKKSKKFAL